MLDSIFNGNAASTRRCLWRPWIVRALLALGRKNLSTALRKERSVLSPWHTQIHPLAPESHLEHKLSKTTRYALPDYWSKNCSNRQKKSNITTAGSNMKTCSLVSGMYQDTLSKLSFVIQYMRTVGSLTAPNRWLNQVRSHLMSWYRPRCYGETWCTLAIWLI